MTDYPKYNANLQDKLFSLSDIDLEECTQRISESRLRKCV